MGWYIAGGLLALILALLLVPVRLLAKYSEDLSISGKWLFWTMTLYPQPEKQKKPEKETPARPEQTPQKKKRKLMAEEVIDGFIDYVARCRGGIRLILRSLGIRRLRIDWTIVGEDPADCAVRYGRICAYLSSALAVARNFVRIQKVEFHVWPDFLAEEETFHAEAEASLTPLMALLGGGGIGLGLLGKWLSDTKKKRERLRRIHKAKKRNPPEQKEQTSKKERQT